MSSVTGVLLVAAGAALGGAFRYLVALPLNRWGGLSLWGLPAGTWMVNVLGSLAFGYVAAVYADREWVRLFVLVGLLGGFTTFSSFSHETLGLLQTGKSGVALAYITLSVLVCVVAAWAGMSLGTLRKG